MEISAIGTGNVAKMESAEIKNLSVMGLIWLGMYTYKNPKHIFNLIIGQKRKCKLFVEPQDNLVFIFCDD